MNIILLSGGSGNRLWPLSNDIRSKQFIKIFRKPEHDVPMGTDYSGDYESMIQRVYRQIKMTIPDATVTIATNKSQISAIHNQLGLDVNISVEPCWKSTFPAIALSAAFLHEKASVPEDEAIVVCPVDSYVDDLANLCVFLMNHYSGNETVNAGSGKELSIRELTELVARVIGYKGQILWVTSKPNGTPRKLLDISKATSLGWSCKTDLEEGIRLSYQDFLTNPIRAER